MRAAPTRALLIALAVGLVLFLLDRALLRAEERGWIYYRRRKASPGSRASALLELHAILEPQKKHVLEQRNARDPETDDEGDRFK